LRRLFPRRAGRNPLLSEQGNTQVQPGHSKFGVGLAMPVRNSSARPAGTAAVFSVGDAQRDSVEGVGNTALPDVGLLWGEPSPARKARRNAQSRRRKIKSEQTQLRPLGTADERMKKFFRPDGMPAFQCATHPGSAIGILRLSVTSSTAYLSVGIAPFAGA